MEFRTLENVPVVVIADVFNRSFSDYSIPMVLDYIRRPEIEPFIIISDINMPKLGGFELRNIILEEEVLADKDIPYIFISNAQDEHSIKQANKLSIQGYIHKGNDYNKYKEKIKNLVDYWKENINSFSSKKN